MSDPQLACLAISVAPLTLGAIWAMFDMAARFVGGPDTPADPVETISVLAGHAGRIAAMIPALVTTAIVAVFAWAVRP